MKILQLNVRLTEGGAAQVALALHQGLQKLSVDCVFAYGYSKGARPNKAEVVNSVNVTSRAEVLSKYLQNRVFGYDIFDPLDRSKKVVRDLIGGCDVVHLHCLHSYYINYANIIDEIILSGKPVIWTMHDHWLITGRCAFLDGCNVWEQGCGKCLTMKNYPPAIFNSSVDERERKIKKINELISKNKTIFVSPSRHLAKNISDCYLSARVDVIPNGISFEIENEINACRYNNFNELSNKNHSKKIKVVVMAHDLSYEGKTDRGIVNRFISMADVEIHTIGKNSPFASNNVINHGEIRSRNKIVDLISKADCLLFTSVVDNFPLTICEALCCGCPVIALKSPAADEVLGLVGIKTLSRDDIANDNLIDHVKKIVESNIRPKLGEKAMQIFSAQNMINRYHELYREALS